LAWALVAITFVPVMKGSLTAMWGDKEKNNKRKKGPPTRRKWGLFERRRFQSQPTDDVKK